QLKAFLPGTLGGLDRQALSANRQAAMGMQVSEASATYADDAQRVEIEVTDLVALGGMMAMATAFGGESESESESGYERTYVRDGQRIHERWDATSGYGEYSVLVGDRFQVEASGQVADMGQLKRMVGSMDLDGLARLKDAGARRRLSGRVRPRAGRGGAGRPPAVRSRRAPRPSRRSTFAAARARRPRPAARERSPCRAPRRGPRSCRGWRCRPRRRASRRAPGRRGRARRRSRRAVRARARPRRRRSRPGA